MSSVTLSEAYHILIETRDAVALGTVSHNDISSWIDEYEDGLLAWTRLERVLPTGRVSKQTVIRALDRAVRNEYISCWRRSRS